MNEPRRLALRAATAAPDEALAAWRQFLERYHLADLWDDEVHRLLPLVWHRFGDEVGAEHAERLKGSYRKAWATNQHLRQRGGEVVAALAERGIDSLVLGGAAVGSLAFADQATRPLRAVDLLVRGDDAVGTWRALEGLGYSGRAAPPTVRSSWRREPGDEWYLRLRHPRTFDRGPLDVVDVHTTLAPALVAADPAVADVSEVWDRSGDVDLGGVAASTLSSTDHLLRTLLLGWAGPGGLARRVDARMLLDRTGVDRALLTTTATRHRCGLVVDQRLAELDEPRVGAAPDRRERVAARLRGGAAQFVTSTRGLGPVATVARAPDFLVDRWQVANRRQLPLVVAQRLRHRLRK